MAVKWLRWRKITDFDRGIVCAYPRPGSRDIAVLVNQPLITVSLDDRFYKIKAWKYHHIYRFEHKISSSINTELFLYIHIHFPS